MRLTGKHDLSIFFLLTKTLITMKKWIIRFLAILASSLSFAQDNTITLSAAFNDDCNPLTRIRLYQPGTTEMEFEVFESFGSNDELTISNLPSGTYDLLIRPENFLQKGFPEVAIIDGSTIEIGEFIQGDITNSNEIGIADFSLFSSAYSFSEGEAGYLSSADINCSGEIDIADFSLFSSAYGSEGDAPPLEGGGSGPAYPEGTVHCIPGGTEVVEVLNPETGRIWMDRNLGALQVATSSTDELAYGDLYQWGRFSDGHQCRDSETTTVLASSPIDTDDLFIINFTDPYDWLEEEDESLWQGSDGVNNPCPAGFRLPTIEEWNEEAATWDSQDQEGAFNSPLKLTMGGARVLGSGPTDVGDLGYYWSSSPASTDRRSNNIGFSPTFYGNADSRRYHGYCIRCIKE
jgi:uncharacterized protein (TIGR02145 family)